MAEERNDDPLLPFLRNTKAPTVSNLWSFAGLAPGKDRKIKGQKCPFNQFLRAKLCGVLGLVVPEVQQSVPCFLRRHEALE